MNSSIFALLALFVISCIAQRSPYAGRVPVGYPVLASTMTTANPLADRLAVDPVPTTTMRLPIETLGDVELYNRLRRLPIDQQPFWLINWQALEAQRNNPQTYNNNRNNFIDVQG